MTLIDPKKYIAALAPPERKADPYGAGTPSPLGSFVGTGGEPVPRAGGPGQIPHYLKPIPINTRDISVLMRRHLEAEEPRLVQWLYSTWTANADALKFQEIRNAIRDGQLNPEWIARWQEQYTALINERIAPSWRDTHIAASGHLAGQGVRQGFRLEFSDQARRVQQWIRIRGGELIAEMTTAQHTAMRSVLHHHIIRDPIPPAQLSRLIRPMVGLTSRQAQAVTAFRGRLVAQELPLKTIEHRVQGYAGYLRRVRAERIARTETAFAYNNGMLETIRQSLESGAIQGTPTKTFYTAADERVCDFCGPMHNQTIELEQTFPGATKRLPNLFMPPLHPNCRCTVIFGIV